MADAKISQLTLATTPLDGTEVLPIVQSGSTVKVSNNDLRPRQIQSNATSGVMQIVGPAAASTRVMTVPNANFTAARTDAAQSFTGDQTLSTGNLIQGTAAKGFNFTANTPAAGMTSRLLNWYEEGTWTPSVGGTATYNIQKGFYTRIGRQVIASMDLHINVLGTGSASTISGLPFTVGNNQSGVAAFFTNLNLSVVSLSAVGNETATSMVLLGLTAAAVSTTYAIAALKDNSRVILTLMYTI